MVLPGSQTVLTAIVLQGGKNLNIGAYDLKTSRLKSLLPGNTPTYVNVATDRGDTGYIVFGQDGALRAVKFDLASSGARRRTNHTHRERAGYADR